MNSPTGASLLLPAPDTLLLQLAHPEAEACRAELAAFAELESSPDHLHTYRLSDLGLWNARAAGVTADHVVDALERHSGRAVPQSTIGFVEDAMGRFGRVVIEGRGDSSGMQPSEDASTGTDLTVTVDDPRLLDEFLDDEQLGPMLRRRLDPYRAILASTDRGRLKQLLVERRWPADDRAR